MLPRCLSDRSLHGKGYWRKYVLDAVFQNFECKKSDMFSMENPLEGIAVPPLACSFSKVSQDILALADEDGNIIVMDTLKSGPPAIKKDWHAHSNAVFDLDWMPGENKLVTASGDQTLALWDVDLQEKVLLFSGHTSSVKSVAFHSSSKDLLLSGSRDGHIMLWDRRINKQQNGSVKFIHDIPGAHDTTLHKKSTNKAKNSSQYSVTAVAFQNENTFASAGCADGTIKLWDLRKMSGNKTTVVCKSTFACQSKKGRPYGISNLIFDHAQNYLFASCLDGSIYQYDCINYKSMPVTCYRGHKVSSFFVKLSISPDDKYILSGSSDSCAYIWPIRDTHHLGNAPTHNVMSGATKLVGHNAEVTSVAWCRSDLLRLVTLSDDNTTCIWRPDRRNRDERFDDFQHQPYGYAVKCHVKSIPSTPRKCFFTSPIKKSPSQKVLQSLNNLPSNFKMATPSPTITSFFSKSSVKKGILSTTPKKLILSPRKGLGDANGISSGRGVKRKLCIDEDDNNIMQAEDGQPRGAKSSKIQKLDDKLDSQVNCQSLDMKAQRMQEGKGQSDPSTTLFSGINLGISTSCVNVLKEKSPNMPMSNDAHIGKDMMQNKFDEKAFSKVIYNNKASLKCNSSLVNFSSPTANLPDSKREAYYKTLQGIKEDKITSKNLPKPLPQQTQSTSHVPRFNWLTELSLKKNFEKSVSGRDSSPSGKLSKTPGKSKDNKGVVSSPKTTPKSRKR